MTLQQKLERIGSALAAALPNVYHYWRPQMQAPFCVWAEEAEAGALNANNRKQEQVITGVVDYFTLTEYDPALDTIQDTLAALQGELAFGWALSSVMYEEDTNLIHYQWTWEVA